MHLLTSTHQLSSTVGLEGPFSVDIITPFKSVLRLSNKNSIGVWWNGLRDLRPNCTIFSPDQQLVPEVCYLLMPLSFWSTTQQNSIHTPWPNVFSLFSVRSRFTIALLLPTWSTFNHTESFLSWRMFSYVDISMRSSHTQFIFRENIVLSPFWRLSRLNTTKLPHTMCCEMYFTMAFSAMIGRWCWNNLTDPSLRSDTKTRSRIRWLPNISHRWNGSFQEIPHLFLPCGR